MFANQNELFGKVVRSRFHLRQQATIRPRGVLKHELESALDRLVDHKLSRLMRPQTRLWAGVRKDGYGNWRSLQNHDPRIFSLQLRLEISTRTKGKKLREKRAAESHRTTHPTKNASNDLEADALVSLTWRASSGSGRRSAAWASKCGCLSCPSRVRY